jgi:hypothetical protein
MKNRIDPFGKRTRALPACSEVPQPTAPPRDPTFKGMVCLYLFRERNKCLNILEFLRELSGAIKRRKFIDYLVANKTIKNNASSQLLLY